MALSDEQKKILYHIVNDIKKKDKQQVTLGGYAGTGKSYLIGYLRNFFPEFAVCAFTGKAANVLSKRAIPASTIHSLIYEPHQTAHGVEFTLKQDVECKGFIVDESSMISEEIYEDLAAFGYPMIFVGDHGQLEPVGTDFNMMWEPDYRLETIHRNAGEIARFAEWLRFGKSPFSFQGDNSQVMLKLPKDVTVSDRASADQVICAYNATRVEVNAAIRKHLGLKGLVTENDKVICIQNSRLIGVFNGMQGYVEDLYTDEGRKCLDFRIGHSKDDVIHGIPYDKKQFGQEKSFVDDWYFGMPVPFDYAYCITCHKAQGDEFDHVHVIEQKCNKWDHNRWAYTAASRARTFLTWELSPY